MAADNEIYDYIVVGSGSAGAVVAARLSEDPAISVLLLEAGGKDNNVWLHVPLGYAKVHFNEALSWGYNSEPEPELNDRQIFCSRGKVLGGSSAINGLVYVRGTPLDYAIWRQMGAEGWGYDDVLPYYRKAERQQHGANPYHGGEGPLGVEDPAWRNDLAENFISAAENVGIPRNPDFNGVQMEGAGYYQLTTAKGRRASSAMAYLRPIRGRKNVHILTHALATRVDVEDGRATGVVYERGGVVHRAAVRGEVILSGGSFNSPQLLQLSGIGPAGLLGRHGIEVKADLPGVGENLSDHILVGRGFRTNHRQTINSLMRNPVMTAITGLRYLLDRSGPLAIGAGLAGAFTYTQPGPDAPDMQVFFAPYAAAVEQGALAKYSGFTLAGNLCRPESRGTVHIRSNDPHEHPAIVGNYLATENDRRGTIGVMRMLEKIAAAAPLNGNIIEEVWPGRAVRTDEEILNAVREMAWTGFHHVGTCRMGSDEMAVVDPTLKVHGIRGLRVADGSIMPTVISGNTNAACIMIGEKCADLVKADR